MIKVDPRRVPPRADILPKVGDATEIRLFCSYSHRDEALWNELAKHLKLLERQGLVRSWHDRKIGAGDDWSQAIDRNLREADVILLLISADFVASDYCFDIEMKTAMERHAAGCALVVPVILRPVDWRATPFGRIQALPKDGKPVTTFDNIDVALEQVAVGVRGAIEKLRMARGGEIEPSGRPPLAAPGLPPAWLDAVSKLLTQYIGPIGPVVVRRSASRCRNLAELCLVVSLEIDNPKDRARFQAEARTLKEAED